jgi:hypothetical protein
MTSAKTSFCVLGYEANLSSWSELALLSFYPPPFAAASQKVLDLQKSAKDFADIRTACGRIHCSADEWTIIQNKSLRVTIGY